MRAPVAVVLILPALLVSQEPSQQSSGPDSAWRSQLSPALAAYETHRSTARAAFEKRHADVRARENAARAVARDEFGLSEANLMDPAGFARGVEARQALLLREDSSATGFLAAWRAGDPNEARRALRWRLQHLENFATIADTSQVYARELLRAAQRGEDFYKSEDNPSRPAARRAFVKKSLDYHEKVIRMARSRISLYSDFSETLRNEQALLNKSFAPLLGAP
jgi:hypothetical protein